MKKLYCLLSLLLLMAATAAFAAGTPGEDKDALFQVSTLRALQEGVYDGVVTIKELRRHGDFGIGTYEGLDGEMACLDGEFYQIRADGKVCRVDAAVKTPFAVVTFFESDKKTTLKQSMDYKQLQEHIQTLLPTKNIPYAIKITGYFKYIKTRSVPRQTKPYPRLVEVTKNQPTFEMRDVKGTILGYWLPEYLSGVNMAGYHFHFLTDDKKAGGHLLECQMMNANLEIDYTYGLNLILPAQSPFYNADLTGNKHKESEKIEK